MWQRLGNWWRQRFGAVAALQSPIVAGAERRVWVRHPCDIAATLRPAHDSAPSQVAARVRNISRGGISLEVGQPFATGDLLSVDLAGPESSESVRVLAYVVHAGSKAPDRWLLGCIFAVELNDADLRPFDAQRVPTVGPDLRAWVRFDTQLEASYQLTRNANEGSRVAKVVNVSPSGMALLISEEVDVGVLMNVNCPGDSRHPSLRILATVVRATRLGAEWVIGCTFIRELDDAELTAVLAGNPGPSRT